MLEDRELERQQVQANHHGRISELERKTEEKECLENQVEDSLSVPTSLEN